ncbi:MAG TPA: UDP-N-acetylmuramoyl-L-alanine--D-glutamate ligase [Dehalococcoidia bacterium]|nr:UDP-N-acetylmuramoyl-L-alanine--D-glutamate ligase [Dehalococcoidia bacterium]
MIDTRRLYELDFTDRRVTVVGLGVEGVDMVRYLSRQHAYVTASDSKTSDRLADSLREVEPLHVNVSLGKDQAQAIADAETLFVSQGVPLDLPPLKTARDNGVPFMSMVGLFFELCPGPIIGITGSSGKTTTTALVAEMLKADDQDVFVGGNIGVGLLDRLEDIRPYTRSVLEISHTQLQLVDRSPHIAAILNITPNHLDRFSWDDYVALKARIIEFQEADDIAVLGYDNAETRALEPKVRGRLLWFSMTDTIPGDGVFVRDGRATARVNGIEQPLFLLDEVSLRGRHNQENAVAAAAVGLASGASPAAITMAVRGFAGVEHRLELVAEFNGAGYYNDSIATTPERTLAGMRSFSGPIVLLLGGRDKHLPLEELAAEAHKRCRAVVLFGESAEKLEAALLAAGSETAIIRGETLEEAVTAAHGAAQPGDVVLLSPACTSYDAYDNFEQRGEHFRRLVGRIAGEAQSSIR